MICYIILITVDVPIVKYIFVTLATSCSICIYPILWPGKNRAVQLIQSRILTSFARARSCRARHNDSWSCYRSYECVCAADRDGRTTGISVKVWPNLQSQLCNLNWTTCWRCCIYCDHLDARAAKGKQGEQCGSRALRLGRIVHVASRDEHSGKDVAT